MYTPLVELKGTGSTEMKGGGSIIIVHVDGDHRSKGIKQPEAHQSLYLSPGYKLSV